MKRYFPLLVSFLVLVFIATTGFQCGSADVTSAKLYMSPQQKQFDKAEQALLREISKNPQNEEAWFLLGQVRLELKNYAGMNEAWGKALDLSKTHEKEIAHNRLAIWAMLYNEGVNSYNKGRENPKMYDSALAAFDLAINMVPDSANTYYVAALVQYAKNNIPACRANLESVLKRTPGNTDAARMLGQTYYLTAGQKLESRDTLGAKKDYLKATEAYETIVKAKPGDAEAITSLIDAYDRADQPEKALALTKNAVEKDPGNKIYRFAYGVFLLKKEDYQGATDQFKKAVDTDPNFTDATYNLGVSYLNWGVEMRAKALKRAEEESQKGNRNFKVDKSYEEKFKQALPYLEKSAETRQDDSMLWQQLGKVYATLGMSDKAKAAFERYDKILKGN
jgi:tetratricopeptide (TPR) repeat protein